MIAKRSAIKKTEAHHFSGLRRITSTPFVFQVAGALATQIQPNHILMYAHRLNLLAAYLQLEILWV
ncbi:MAG: hypothetical protein ACRC5A_04560 [Enterobacteriaceae bacterium]